MPNNPTEYERRRAETLDRFREMSLVEASTEVQHSPSGNYSIEISRYSASPNSWNYTRGVVKCHSTGRVIGEIIRNYGVFWFTWVLKKSGSEFLLCGEDYQGYLVIDLANSKKVVTFPTVGYKGHGFCWAAAYPSPNGQYLAVEGCYWACPYDLVIYDFSKPLSLPLPELFRVENLGRFEGWSNERSCSFTAENEAEQLENFTFEAP